MKRIIASLAILLILAGGTALAGEFVMLSPNSVVSPTKVTGDLDSQQPDTIFYDNGTGTALWTGTNYYGKVRFTCPANFELRSIYVQVLNQNNSQAGCDTWVYSDVAGNPGTLLGGPFHISGPFTTYVFRDAEVSPYIQFTEGQSFHIVFGPAPGGPYQGGSGWWLFFDSGTTTSRSTLSQSQTGPWQGVSGDLILRAGGDLEDFTDIACTSTFDNPAKWFIPAADSVQVKAQIRNVGTGDITAYDIEWTARNASGSTVWTSSGSFGALAAGATAIQTASSYFNPPLQGYYVIESHVTTAGDVNNENDFYSMELGVGDLGWDWLKYDDGTFERPFSFQPGSGWGQRFDPVDYPVKVDTVRVNLAAANAVTDIRLFKLAASGLTFTQLWQYTGPVVQGWNTFHLPADSTTIYDGYYIVGYIFQTGCSLWRDDDLPTAAANENMPATAYQIQNYGESMGEDDSGDWAMRLFCSESSLIPPDPVIAANPDTLRFGAVTIGTSSNQTLWVKNVGGGDVLQVTNILINPTVYTSQPHNFSVQQGDSVAVTVTFTPPAEETYNGIILIQNNTAVPNFFVRVEGSGTTMSVHQPDEGVVPAEFSLAQNYPNPFNPSTEIRFGLPISAKVKVTVFNVLGQEIATIANRQFDAGYHSVMWDASSMPSGIYFYRLEAGSFTDMKKMVLMK